MRALRLLRADSPRELRNILAISCLAGLANAVLLGLVNSVAELAALGEPIGLQPAVLFLNAAAVYFLAQRTSLLRANAFFEARLGELRLRLADKIRRSELRILESIGRGELYTKVAQETNHLSQAFPVLLTAAQNGCLMLFCLLYIATLSLVAFLVIGAMIALALLGYWVQRQSLVQRLEQVTAGEGEMLDSLGHFLDGFQEVRLNADRSDDLMAHFTAVVTRLRDLVIGIGDTWVGLFLFSSAFGYLLLGTIGFVLPAFHSGYTDVIYKLTAAALFCIGPITSISSVAPIYTKAMVGLDQVFRLEEVLDARSQDLVDSTAKAADFSGFREIACREITFSYRDEDGRPLFTSGPWDLNLRRGEVLFLVGGNGCGKSTALKLLCGLYHPDEGWITVDGARVERAQLQSYRELFAAVFSDFHLFRRLHGLEGVSPDMVRRHLERLELHEKVDVVDGHFTHLDLSTGQRKRLAMVVTLLEDREVLIFDEWAADQESRFREVFYLELLPELKARGKTVVVVTHDDRYFHACDRLVKLDLGSIVMGSQAPPPRDPPGAPCPS